MRLLICIFLLISCSAMVLPAQNLEPEKRNLFVRVEHGLYGIGDSTHFWLEDSPKGDTIFHLGNEHFGVRESNGRFKIVDTRFKTLLSDLEEIRQTGSVLLAKKREGWTIFPTIDGLRENLYDSIRTTGNYVLLYRRGKQGLLTTSLRTNRIVEPEYDHVGPYYDGLLLIDHGKLGWQGRFQIPVAYDHIYQARPDIMAARDSRGTVYYSYLTGKALNTEPSDSVVLYDGYYKRVRGRMQSIFQIEGNSLVAEIEGENIHPFDFGNHFERSGYCVIGRDSACALYRHGTRLTDFLYKNILPSQLGPSFFRVLQESGIGVIYENGEVQLSAQYTDVLTKLDNHYVVRRGSRLGLVSRGDSLILPCEYRNITFLNKQYVYLSKDGDLFGIYDYVARREITPYKYRDFTTNDNFILARQEATSDIYLEGQLVMSDLYDAEINQNTAKGYKNGKIYIGSLRSSGWEIYEYEIPSYQIRKKKEGYHHYLRSIGLTQHANTYDYCSGRWGVFDYSSGKWAHAPLAHGGNYTNDSRLLDFPVATDAQWQGLNFRVEKKVAPIEIAWNRNSACNWIDVNHYSYSSQGKDRIHYAVSPICYTEPGTGKCLSNFLPSTINTGFPGDGSKSVLSVGGIPKIGPSGHIGLSAFITQLSASGNVHPASLADYSMLIDPRLYVSFGTAKDHIFHPANSETHVSPYTSFEWVDPMHLNPAIVKVGGKYGLLSDSGTYLLKPEYESLAPLAEGNSTYLAGVKSKSYHIYDPNTGTTSREIPELLSFNNTHLLVKADSLRLAVLDMGLDTLIVSAGTATLLDDSCYVVRKDGLSTVYKNRKPLFAHQSEHTERINTEHFLLYDYKGYFLVSVRGDTVYRSSQSVRYAGLGDNYLLDDGRQRLVFDKKDQVIFRFDKEPYLVTSNKQLIVKEKESTVLLEKNSRKEVRINGRYARASGKYVITRLDKYKQVYDFTGKALVHKTAKVKAVSERYFSYQAGKKKYLLYDVQTGDKKTLERLNVTLGSEGLEYDDEEPDTSDSTEMHERLEENYAIVGYSGKYGLKKGKELVLPCRFFDIQKAGQVFLVQHKVEYKLYDLYNNRFFSNESYEKVIPYKSYFQVWKRGVLLYIMP